MDVAQLSQILKQATGVVAARGEGVFSTTRTIADISTSPRGSA
jgi:hypothetical protein